MLILLLVCSISIRADIIDEKEDIIENLWNKYLHQAQTNNKQKTAKIYRVIGEENDEINKLIAYEWQYENITYQLFYDNQASLGDDIYYLAIFTKDITNEMTIERFRKGVQGYHYGIDQVCEWANSYKINENIENQLIKRLIEDNILISKEETYESTGKVKHILGVAYTGKRPMKSILQHEIIHILWDEDPSIQIKYTEIWNKMSDEEKNQVVNNLKGYSREKESQLIEEWAVKEIEKENLL